MSYGTISIVTIFCLFLSFNSVFGQDENPYELGQITVSAQVLSPVKQAGDAIYSGTKITPKGLEIKGIASSSSIYEALDLLPGVLMEATDPFGLGTRNLRCRGIKGMFGSITVEGIPDYGIMPIGPRQSIFDTENLTGVSLYKGASPADLGTGNGSKGGTVELSFRRPEERPAFEIKQSIGSNRFSRTFARVDTGLLPTHTGLFLSYSYADGDKWKGSGELGPRNHIDFGLSQDLDGLLRLDAFFSFNDADRHLFRPLLYHEAKELDHYYRLDYEGSRSNNPALDRYYYKYHQSSATNRDYRFIISAAPSDSILLTLKPYYSNEDAWRTETLAKNLGAKTKYFMIKKIRDLDRIGVIPEIRWETAWVSMTAGYWYESAGLEKFVKKSAITSSGLKDLGYSYYAENKGRSQVHSPYLKISGQLGRLKWQTGLKYFYYREPASTGFLWSSGHLIEQPDLALKRQSWDTWLPSVGIGYSLRQNLEVYCNYGRTYIRPYMFVPITNLYVENRAKFRQAGMVLQDIFDSWKMETSDNIDIGIRFMGENFSLEPVIFYARHHNVLVNGYDPRVGINYYQNDGEARSIGAELTATFHLPLDIQLFFMPSYTSVEYCQDIVRNGNTFKIDGKQLPDTPKWMLKGGLTYSWENLELVTLVNWTGKRYGDILHNEAVPSHASVDLSARYSVNHFWKFRRLSADLELKNIFDSHFIGVIDLFDDTAGGKASYYAASPFSAIFTLSAEW